MLVRTPTGDNERRSIPPGCSSGWSTSKTRSRTDYSNGSASIPPKSGVHYSTPPADDRRTLPSARAERIGPRSNIDGHGHMPAVGIADTRPSSDANDMPFGVRGLNLWPRHSGAFGAPAGT